MARSWNDKRSFIKISRGEYELLKERSDIYKLNAESYKDMSLNVIDSNLTFKKRIQKFQNSRVGRILAVFGITI